ncbi:MAG: GntR family transcriptional regulator [Gammaproteobacteria bacterium]|nr:GntR family transcriptional regulator [Gammaproteobacteria bacterium]
MNTKVNKKKANKENLPIYLHTRDRLVAEIEKGAFKPHDALPSERLLADHLGISRMTARQALVEVERAGYAYRKGRQGRYVAEQRLSYDVGSTLSFAAQALRESINLSIEVLSTSTEPADEMLAGKLAIKTGSPVHIYKRVFKVDGRAVLVEHESSVAERFPDLLEQDLSQSSTLLHESRYGVIGSKGRLNIRCIEITAKDKKLFATDCAPYGLEMDSVIFDSQGKPFCCGYQIWCSEMAEFTLLATPA